jgi:hypothetical protein
LKFISGQHQLNEDDENSFVASANRFEDRGVWLATEHWTKSFGETGNDGVIAFFRLALHKLDKQIRKVI